MEQRRRAAVLASSGAIVSCSSLLLIGSRNIGPSGDFLRGFAIGSSIILIAFAVVLIMRSQRAT